MTQDEEVEHPPPFTYKALPNPATHIRLLQILAVHEDEDQAHHAHHVHAHLSVWPLATAPPYHAISYTWGNPNETTHVVINDQCMVVRRNCEYVLKQAKWYADSLRQQRRIGKKMWRKGKKNKKNEKEFYFWCDAICIDQGNYGEKGFQVALMGRIYKGAERVLACVGEEAEGSELVFSELSRRWDALLLKVIATLEFGRAVKASKKHEDGLARIGFNVSPARRGFIKSFLLSVCSSLWSRRLHRRRRFSTGPQGLTQALLSLSQRDYFRRVWIYQELFLGHDILLCCGRDISPLRVLYGMLHAVFGSTKRSRQHGLGSHGRKQGLLGLGQCEDMVEAGAVSGLGMKYFWEALYTVSMLDCTDARDRVYGVLSLVEWSTHEEPVFPDYERGAFELGVEVLRRLGTFHRFVVIRSLELLSEHSIGLVEARRRRCISTAVPLEYSENAREIPASVLDKTDLLTHSFGICVREDDEQLHFDVPGTSRIRLTLDKWPAYHERKWTYKNQDEVVAMTILVPVETVAGDYCIFYQSEFWKDGWSVLVAHCVDEMLDTIDETDHNRRFMIKGKGLAFVDGAEMPLDDGTQKQSYVAGQFLDVLRQRGMPFDVYCGAEDALCLESSFISELPSDPDALLQDESFLSEYFDTRICGGPGSSFAFQVDYRGREWAA